MGQAVDHGLILVYDNALNFIIFVKAHLLFGVHFDNSRVINLGQRSSLVLVVGVEKEEVVIYGDEESILER